MEMLIAIALLAFLGLMFGSFAGASVWRLRSHQLIEDAKEGEAVDPQELRALRPLAKQTVLSDRSCCLKCGHTLAWYDLLPLISWLALGGKCRYCKVPIGMFEPLMEIGTAGVFVLSYLFWPLPLETPIGLSSFILWLIALVMLVILFAYDLKWFLLPDQVTFPLVGVGVLMSLLRVWEAPEVVPVLLSIGGATLVLSGLYYFLWLLSKGRWIGFGDIKLGLALALLLADWRLALVALLAANLIGSLVVVPGMVFGKIGRKSHVPFGPFLIAGAILAMLVGEVVADAYMAIAF